MHRVRQVRPRSDRFAKFAKTLNRRVPSPTRCRAFCSHKTFDCDGHTLRQFKNGKQHAEIVRNTVKTAGIHDFDFS